MFHQQKGHALDEAKSKKRNGMLSKKEKNYIYG